MIDKYTCIESVCMCVNFMLSELFFSPKYTVKVKVKVAQLCYTLCNPMDYTVHGILQARILEWVAFPFSRGSSQHRDQNQESNPGLLHCRQILYQLIHKGSP